jgi:hypothetical protein
MEESLREFENMRLGKYASGAATLRMKMEMNSPNPNMWDQVLYLVPTSYPHALMLLIGRVVVLWIGRIYGTCDRIHVLLLLLLLLLLFKAHLDIFSVSIV